MFEQLVGRVVSGALWGVGAGVVWRVVSGNKQEGEQRAAGVPFVRPVAKTAMKGAIVASDRVRGIFSEAREGIEDLYAEAQAEHHTGGSVEAMPQKQADRGNIPIEA